MKEENNCKNVLTIIFEIMKEENNCKNVLTIIFEIMKEENNTNTSSFNTFNRC